MKAIAILGLVSAILCGGCATTEKDNTAYELQLLNTRMERMENRILELDRDIAFLFDEKIEKAKQREVVKR